MTTPRRLTVTWIALLAATGLAWQMGHNDTQLTPAAAGTAIVVVSFLKIRLVLLEFMELRLAPMPMRIGCECWLLGVCACILFLYLT